MSEPAVSLVRVESLSYQHAVSDKRRPTRYEVYVNGVKIGEVYSHSDESWDVHGRIRTRMRGYSRSWRARVDGRDVVRYGAYTRQRAVEKLVEYVRKDD